MPHDKNPLRRGVTLIELLIVMMIIVVLGALTMSAIGNLGEQARIERTKTIIKRVDHVLMERWQSYKTRPLPLRLTNPNYTSANIACIRMRAIRDLMRMEMPERATDIDETLCPIDSVNLAHNLYGRDGTLLPPISLPARRQISMMPPVYQYANPLLNRYVNTLNALPAAQRAVWGDSRTASAECLYLILAGTRDGETTALDFLAPSEIGDTDGDGMKEILDAWGQPLYFWRWAPGYVNDTNVSSPLVAVRDPHAPSTPVYLNTLQDRTSPDPFDPQRADPQLNDLNPSTPPASPLLPSPSFALRPLVASAGPDRVLDLVTDLQRRYASVTDSSGGGNRYYPNNPFPSFQSTYMMVQVYEAQPYDFAGDGPNWYDNVTNHYVETP